MRLSKSQKRILVRFAQPGTATLTAEDMRLVSPFWLSTLMFLMRVGLVAGRGGEYSLTPKAEPYMIELHKVIDSSKKPRRKK